MGQVAIFFLTVGVRGQRGWTTSTTPYASQPKARLGADWHVQGLATTMRLIYRAFSKSMIMFPDPTMLATGTP